MDQDHGTPSESGPTTQDNTKSLGVGPTNLLKGVPLDQDHGTPSESGPTTQDYKESLKVGPTDLLKGVPQPQITRNLKQLDLLIGPGPWYPPESGPPTRTTVQTCVSLLSQPERLSIYPIDIKVHCNN